MKKTKFLAVIVIAAILVQLFSYASIVQVKGDLTSPSASSNNRPSQDYAATFASYFEGCWHGISSLFDCANKHHHSGQHHCSALDHITVTPQNATIAAGESQTYTVTAYGRDDSNWVISTSPDIVWSINSGSGTYVWTGNSVQVNKTGTWTVTATYKDKSDTATLNVVGHLPTVVSIAVSPKNASILAGTSQAFTATASDGYNTWDVTGVVTWSIDAVAGGSWNQSTGTYTSANAGTWTVNAILGALSDNATLTVNANSATPDHIIISPKTATVAAGTPQDYTVTAYDQIGNSLGDVTSSTTFSAPGASVTGSSVTADNAGSYNVTATYSNLTDTAILTVTGYTVTFTENGLETGTSWNITFGGQEYASTTSTITVGNLSALNYSWSTSSNIQSDQTRYVANQTSGTLSVPNQLAQTIDYSKQYLVTYSATGNVLAISVPAAEWVNSGGQATGSFPAQVINDAQNTRCNFVSDNRPATITQPTAVVGTYQTQYFLTVSSAYATANGEGWYDSGATATASVSSAEVSGGSGVQHVFVNWGGDASGTALTASLSMTSPKTAIASWSTQYLVTYAVVGNALPITVPADEWVSYGAAAQGNFTPTVVNSANDVQCLFVSDNRTQSITEPTTITGKYQTQYKVTLNQSGVKSDAKGTILAVSGIPEEYSQLADVRWVDNGTQLTFSFEATVSSTTANKQYVLTSVNASSPIVIVEPTLILGSYKAQYNTTLITVLESMLILFAIILTAAAILRYRRRRKR